MSYERWMNYIRNAEKSSFCSGKIRKIHYKFNDEAEMIEEYSMETGILIQRAWKKQNNLLGLQTGSSEFNGSLYNWDIELGETIQPTYDPHFVVKETDLTVIF